MTLWWHVISCRHIHGEETGELVVTRDLVFFNCGLGQTVCMGYIGNSVLGVNVSVCLCVFVRYVRKKERDDEAEIDREGK